MGLAFNFFDCFKADIGLGVHNLHTGTLKIMLTDTAPVVTNTVKANITEITPASGYSAGGAAVTSQSYTQTSGTAKLMGVGATITAGAAIGPFRYAVLYNDSATNDPLIGWWDKLSEITMASSDTVQFILDATNGILQVA